MNHNPIRATLGASSALHILLVAPASAITGTFLDRELLTDVRLVTYNVLNDNIFPDTNPTRAERFARIALALDADVWALQEVFSHSAAQVRDLFNTIAPLSGGESWNVFKSGEFAIVSRYSLGLTRGNITPAGAKPVAAALVNLPDATFARDLYLMNVHFKAFSGATEQAQRQQDADAIINWMRDARTTGGTITLATDTPMVVLGDLNLVDGPQPLLTLLDGNIIDNTTYGPDSPPDWDGSNSTDPVPTHNASGSLTYTWRNDSSNFNPSRLDYILYTDSAVSAPHRFVLNTMMMTSADRQATGVQPLDVALDNTGNNFDHLPVVADFRFGSARTLVWNPPDTTWDDTSTNWLNGSSSASFATGDVVRFTNSGVGTVTIDAGGVSPAAIIVTNSAGAYRFIGGAIGGFSTLTKSGNGTLILSNANGYVGGTTATAGTLVVDHPDALGSGSLALINAARVMASTGLPQAIRVTALTIAAGASMDLADNDLVIDYTGATPAADVRAMLIDQRLASSMGSTSTTLGYAENTQAGLTVFGGRSVDPTSILVKFTYIGDSDLDGDVDVADLGNMASRWQSTGVWIEGDFDYTGVVDVNDLGLLASNWQAGVGNPLGPSIGEALASLGFPAVAVPEPASLLLAGMLVLPLSRRRDRRCM